MSARLWCLTLQRDLPGLLSTISVLEVADADLAETIRRLLDEPDTLHIGIHTDMTSAELRGKIRERCLDEPVCLHTTGAVN